MYQRISEYLREGVWHKTFMAILKIDFKLLKKFFPDCQTLTKSNDFIKIYFEDFQV